MIFEVVVAVLGSGSLVAALLSWVIARRKAPVEVDSIVVQGAESAVLSLEKARAAETQRADRAEAENARLRAELDRKDRRIEALEAQLDRCQEMLNDARTELDRIRRGE